MADSTTNLDTISSSQASKEVTANALFDAGSPATLYGRRASATANLTWGFYGGTLNISGTLTAIANGTVALTGSATNYVEADPATGTVSKNTTSFTAGKIPLYSIVCGTSTITSYTDKRAFIPSGQMGQAYGVATLDSGGHIPLAQLPAAIAGAMSYQGTWNANTNTPALSSGNGTKGYYYKVSVAGTTNLDGHAVWSVDDVAVFNGTTWDIIQGGITSGEINAALGFTLSGTANQTYNFPATTANLARTDAGQTFTGVNNFTSPAITTNITTPSTSFDVFNTTATTVNAFGAATTMNIGAATGTLTFNNAIVNFKVLSGTSISAIGATVSSIYIGNQLGDYGSRLQFVPSNVRTNWQCDASTLVNGAFSITPSTVVGGNSFTTPVVTISTALFSTTLPVSIPAGTVSAPSLYWGSDTGTGLYRIGSNNIGFAVSGSKVLDISSTVFGVTGAVSATTSILSSGATAGIGYATGAGGTVTQTGSRTTAVTSNHVCGAITLVSAAGTTAWQTFTVNNSAVAATDTVIVNQKSGTDLNEIHVTAIAAGSFNISFRTTGGTTTEQPVFNFSIIKAVTA